MPPTEDSYHINLTTKGETFATRTDGSRAVTAAHSSGLVLLPDQLNTVRWTADAEQLILKVPRWRLESHLADLIGHRVEEVIDFDSSVDMTTSCGRSLLSAVEFLARELDRPGGIAEMPDIAEFLNASHGYHSYLVGLAKCTPLSHTYDRLGISALWRRAISDQPWWLKFNVQHHTELTQACRDGDTPRAKQLIYQHAEQVKTLVHEVITDAGGQL